MIKEMISKIDYIFEQFSGATPLASVPTEPVASTMMSQVGSRMQGIWGRDYEAKYGKATEEDIRNQIKTPRDMEGFKNNIILIHKEAKLIKDKSFLGSKLKSQNVTSDALAMLLDSLEEVLHTDDARKVAEIIIKYFETVVAKELGNNLKSTDLRDVIIKETIKFFHSIPKDRALGLIKIIFNPDNTYLEKKIAAEGGTS